MLFVIFLNRNSGKETDVEAEKEIETENIQELTCSATENENNAEEEMDVEIVKLYVVISITCYNFPFLFFNRFYVYLEAHPGHVIKQ